MLSEQTKLKIIIPAGIVVICIIIVSFWMMKRSFNYSWGYESQVESTVCEMVKREYLKNPSDC